MTIRLLWVIVLSACGSAHTATGQRQEVKQQMQAHSPTAQEYTVLCKQAAVDAQARLKALKTTAGAKTIESFLQPLNDLWVVIDRTLNLAGLYRNVHPDAGVRAAASTCEQEFSQIITDIGLSRDLFEYASATDVSGADAATRHYHKNLLRDFRLSGVDRDDATRQKIRQLKDELVQIGQDFDKNVREDVRKVMLSGSTALAGLPPDYVAAHPPDARGDIAVTTDYPDYLPFMSYAKDDGARLALYKTFRQRGFPKNESVLQGMLSKRFALAQLLGFKNWASYITADKMVKSEEAAQSFIDRLSKLAAERAHVDYQELLAQLRRDVAQATEVGDWQKVYLEEQVKKSSYSFDSQAVRAYFPFAKVRQGLFDLVSQLFGVTIEAVEDASVWHPDVKAYDMREAGVLLGRFYLDLHPRANKYKHAAAFPMVAGLAGRQRPQAALVCNFPQGDEALLEHNDVQTFFHEFGHLLHHMFASKGQWVAQSGISTEWDFVEAPSQMLEEWTYDRDTLKGFAKNAQGQSIDDGLIASMRRARDFGKGLWVTHQLFYAAVSLQFHNHDPANLNTNQLMQQLQRQYSAFAYVPDTYFQLSFGHLDGYSAIYYTYMWSLVIAKDLFAVFATAGLHDTPTAALYKRTVLEPGGTADAAELVHHFLGRDFSFDAFARWLDSKS